MIYFRQPLNKVTNANEENHDGFRRNSFHDLNLVLNLHFFHAATWNAFQSNALHLSVLASVLCAVFSQFEMSNFVE